MISVALRLHIFCNYFIYFIHDCPFKCQAILRIPGQGGHDSEIDLVSIPKLIRSRFRDEAGQGFRF